jgi:hypothetical protein
MNGICVHAHNDIRDRCLPQQLGQNGYGKAFETISVNKEQ